MSSSVAVQAIVPIMVNPIPERPLLHLEAELYQSVKRVAGDTGRALALDIEFGNPKRYLDFLRDRVAYPHLDVLNQFLLWSQTQPSNGVVQTTGASAIAACWPASPMTHVLQVDHTRQTAQIVEVAALLQQPHAFRPFSTMATLPVEEQYNDLKNRVRGLLITIDDQASIQPFARYWSGNHRIEIRKNLTFQQKVSLLLHEFGHFVQEECALMEDSDVEFEVESCAFIIMCLLKQDNITSHNYLARHLPTAPSLKQAIANIDACVLLMMEMLFPKLIGKPGFRPVLLSLPEWYLED